MADQGKLQRKNQQLIRKNCQLESELQKKENALTDAATFLKRNASAKRLPSKKLDQLWLRDEEH